MDQKNEVTLFVGGKKYLGWTEIQIESGLTSFSRGCSLAATRTSRTASLCEGIEEGLEAVVKIGDDTVLTGYIVKKVTSYSAKEAKIQITIKSKTVDLEECAIPLGKPHEWAGVSVAGVIRELASCYGIEVVDNGLGISSRGMLRCTLGACGIGRNVSVEGYVKKGPVRFRTGPSGAKNVWIALAWTCGSSHICSRRIS